MRSKSSFLGPPNPSEGPRTPKSTANARKSTQMDLSALPGHAERPLGLCSPPIREIRQIRSFPPIFRVFREFRSFCAPFRPVWTSRHPRCRVFSVPGPFRHLCGRFWGRQHDDFAPEAHVRIFCNSCHFQASPLITRLPTCKAPQKPSRSQIGNKRATAFNQHELKHHLMVL